MLNKNSHQETQRGKDVSGGSILLRVNTLIMKFLVTCRIKLFYRGGGSYDVWKNN